MPKIIKLILILFLASLMAACEKVHEAPAETQPFPSAEVLNQSYDFSGAGPFEVPLTRNFPASSEVRIEITRNADHGEIQLLDNGSLLYRPEYGFSGIDSAKYRVCIGNECSQGRVLLRINSDCSFSVPDLLLECGWGLQELTGIPSEFGCGALSSSVSGNPAIFLNGSVVAGNFRLNRMDTSWFRLSACRPGGICDTGLVRVISGRQQCMDKFRLQKDTFILNRNFTGISINLSLLLKNDSCCLGDIDAGSLQAGSAHHGTATVRHNGQGSVIRYIRNFGSQLETDSIEYSIRSKSGKQSSTRLIILSE